MRLRWLRSKTSRNAGLRHFHLFGWAEKLSKYTRMIFNPNFQSFLTSMSETDDTRNLCCSMPNEQRLTFFSHILSFFFLQALNTPRVMSLAARLDSMLVVGEL